MPDAVPLFVALMPDADLSARVQAYKDRTLELAGPQLYLADPPHLTVYLACFPTSFRAADVLRDVVASLSPPRARVIGWHAWVGDALTGRNTLVCALHPDDKRELRLFQRRVADALAPHRDRAATAARFAGREAALSPEQRANVRDAGFPYLGDGWEPHVTVASIDPAAWDAVYGEFRDRPPAGDFIFPALEEFELHGLEPVSRGRLAFG